MEERRRNDVKIAKIETDIDYIREEQRDIKVIVNQTNKKIDDRFDKVIDDFKKVIETHEETEKENLRSLERTYAFKWVEKTMWIILTATIGGILAILTNRILL